MSLHSLKVSSFSQGVNMVQVTNVVVHAALPVTIELEHLANSSRDTSIRYDPTLFSAVIWQHRKIGGNCLVLSFFLFFLIIFIATHI